MYAMNAICLLFLTIFVPAAGDTSADCTICEGKELLPCERCDGKGVRAVTCRRCAGKRKVPCPVTTCDRGSRPCQACGGAQKIFWDGGETDPCKACAKKGQAKCGFCKASGKVDCPICHKSGRQSLSCAACLGTGSHPCPRRHSTACQLCQGKQRLGCRVCVGRGEIKEECAECLGWSVRFCTDKCQDGKFVCRKCFGTGKIRYIMSNSGTSAGRRNCASCKARGYTRCKHCKGGIEPCKHPEQRRSDCKACDQGLRRCPLCG